MPVLVTLATINALFPRDTEAVGFLNPDALRARCKEVIENPEIREQAFMLTRELQQLTQQYQKAVNASLNAYLKKSAEWNSSADDLIEILEPLDIVRIQTLQDIVYARRLMREILTVEQWNEIFR
jgi:hypothetical protein